MISGIAFPNPRRAADHGLLAVGGDFRPLILLEAYAQGIFPWPSEEMPYAWFSPNPRLLLRPEELRISRSLRKALKRKPYQVTFDTAFEAVIHACANVYRQDQGGTWISQDLIDGFLELHHMGFAHSVETWQEGVLVGGLYGLSLGSMFCGESMFHRADNASKIAFVHLVQRLAAWDFHFVDCQVHTPHLAAFGAEEWPRDLFLDALEKAIIEPTHQGLWTL